MAQMIRFDVPDAGTVTGSRCFYGPLAPLAADIKDLLFKCRVLRFVCPFHRHLLDQQRCVLVGGPEVVGFELVGFAGSRILTDVEGSGVVDLHSEKQVQPCVLACGDPAVLRPGGAVYRYRPHCRNLTWLMWKLK
ncbi:hypothetical protein ACF1HJ_40485 [Streptomyces sp. NPDC013978]|uniref:hypothetical protein n=1 Tax=Streptomyces sp. NPDC013978 TaxID=3364869 RepID=UPI0036FED54D